MRIKKEKLVKSLLATALSVMIAVGCCPFTAFAAEGTPDTTDTVSAESDAGAEAEAPEAAESDEATEAESSDAAESDADAEAEPSDAAESDEDAEAAPPKAAKKAGGEKISLASVEDSVQASATPNSVPWSGTDATTKLPTSMDLSQIKSDPNAHAFNKVSDGTFKSNTVYKYIDSTTLFGDISYGYVQVDTSGDYVLSEMRTTTSSRTDRTEYCGIYDSDGTVMKQDRISNPWYPYEHYNTKAQCLEYFYVHLEAGKTYGFAQHSTSGTTSQDRDFRLVLTSADSDPQDTDRDQETGLPNHIDMSNLSSLSNRGYVDPGTNSFDTQYNLQEYNVEVASKKYRTYFTVI